MPDVLVSDLRRRRHRETRDDIVGRALELFQSSGYDRVTIEQIAAAAGVSRRTVYRRFPTKEHVLRGVLHDWLDAWDATVASFSDDAPALDVAEASALAVARHIDSDAARVRAVYAILETAPWVEAAALADRAWGRRVVALLTDGRRGGAADPAVAGIVAGAYLGAIDAMMWHWATTGGHSSVVDATHDVLARLRSIWPEGASRSSATPER